LLAEQVAVVPPLIPVHVQFQGPLPVKVVPVPLEQKLLSGATVKVLPLLVPQEPFTGAGGIRLNVAAILWLSLTLVIL
jgi:hypothetical protein